MELRSFLFFVLVVLCKFYNSVICTKDTLLFYIGIFIYGGADGVLSADSGGRSWSEPF